MTTDGDVKSYDIRFKPCGSEGIYCKETVVAPATSILLTRDSGLKPLTKYKFDVRARSVSQEGKWSELSEYIGMFMHIIYIFTSGPLPKTDMHPQLGLALTTQILLQTLISSSSSCEQLTLFSGCLYVVSLGHVVITPTHPNFIL